MTNLEVKAAKKVYSICEQLREGKISSEDAFPVLVSLGEPAIISLISAVQAQGEIPRNTLLLALHKLGGDEKVALAINIIFFNINNDNYLMHDGEKAPEEMVRNLFTLNRVALPALLWELAGKHHEFAAPIIVNMGAGKEAMQILLKRARTGKNRTQWMERMMKLQEYISKNGLNFSFSSPQDIDFSGIALDKSLRAPRNRHAFTAPDGKMPLQAKKVLPR